jgi:hypothetical protein
MRIQPLDDPCCCLALGHPSKYQPRQNAA